MDEVLEDFLVNVQQGNNKVKITDENAIIRNHEPIDFRLLTDIESIEINLSDREWNQPIYVHDDITEFTLNSSTTFNQPLDFSHCHALENLYLNDLPSFNQEILFPPGDELTNVALGGLSQFNQMIDLSQAEDMTQLTLFLPNWNQPFFPPRVVNECDIDAKTFNQPVEWNDVHVLELMACKNFNQPLSLSVPQVLEMLSVGDAFNQPLDLSHTSMLECLILGRDFNQPLDLRACSNLEALIVDDDDTNNATMNQPISFSNQNRRLDVLHLTHPSFSLPLFLPEITQVKAYLPPSYPYPLYDLGGVPFTQRCHTTKEGHLEIQTLHWTPMKKKAKEIIEYMRQHKVSLRKAFEQSGATFTSKK